MQHKSLFHDAIIVDEVGIEIGVYGKYRLKSVYQPIFQRDGDLLRPFGVEGLVRPFIGGKPVSALDFFAGVQSGQRFYVDSMCRSLHMRNYGNIGVAGLRLFFNFDPASHTDLDGSLERIRYMSARLAARGLSSELLVCEITEAEAADNVTLQRLVEEIRRQGLRVAVDDFGIGHSTPERVQMLKPDIVKLDGGLFRKIAAAPGVAALLGSLVSNFHRSGAEALIEGIETAQQLRLALDAGADMVQGYFLAQPALAGTVFDETPLRIDTLLDQRHNVLKFGR